MKRKIGIFLVVLVLSLSACSKTDGSDDGIVTLRLANASAEDTVTTIFSDKFAELVEEYTDGSVCIQRYHNSALGDDTSLLESTWYGDVDFYVGTTAPQVSFIPRLALFDLPNAFANTDIARTVFDDDEFMELVKDEYEDMGYKLLGYADQGYRVMTTNKKIESLTDFSGQKIRTMENTYHMAYWSSLGASPSPMAYSEVYMGLQQNVIDAQENPYEVIVAAKFYEQQDYLVNTNHLLHIISLVTSDHTFSKLDDMQEAAVLRAAEDAIVWARAEADSRQEDRQQQIEASGTEVVDLTEELRQDVLDSVQDVYSSIEKEVGSELYNAFLSAIERAENNQ